LKLVTNTLRKERANPNEPQPPAIADLTPPDCLSPAAVGVWRDVAPKLLRMGVLSDADMLAAAQLCETVAEVNAYRATLEAEGRTYQTNGASGPMVRARPEIGLLADASRRLAAWLSAFGMTPASRARVSVVSGQPDPASRWFD
jgi:P27 family predicted phage terminase small subunit